MTSADEEVIFVNIYDPLQNSENEFDIYNIYWLKKVLIHDILFVTLVTTDAKCRRFHFPKKEY